MANLYITIKQAAKILEVSPLTLRNWDKNGKLKAHRHPMNNYRVYKIEDLEQVYREIETNAGLRATHKKTELNYSSALLIMNSLTLKLFF